MLRTLDEYTSSSRWLMFRSKISLEIVSGRHAKAVRNPMEVSKNASADTCGGDKSRAIDGAKAKPP